MEDIAGDERERKNALTANKTNMATNKIITMLTGRLMPLAEYINII